MFVNEKCNLHNTSFNRVWANTIITVNFALKNCIDSISQTSKKNCHPISCIVIFSKKTFAFVLSFWTT